MSTRMPHSTTRLLSLLVCAGLALSACDNRDPATEAINQARLDLDKISLPRTPVGESDSAEAALARIVTSLRSATSDASAGQKAAASLLMAQAQLGVGDRRAALATQTEGDATVALVPIRQKLDVMLAEASRSVAAVAYNPEPEIARLRQELTSKEAEIAQRQRDRAQVESDILLLEQGAKERLDMAASRRDEAARISVEAMSLSTHESASRMNEIHRIRREAAKIEVDGLTLSARADLRRPDLAERELLVQQVLSQKAELEAALAGVQRQRTEAAASAAEHAAGAFAAARELDDMIRAALATRSSADARVKAATEAYASAQSNARAAGNDGFALVGAAAQGRGDLEWTRGQDISQLADLLEHASQSPVPPSLSAGDQQTLRDQFAGYARTAQSLRAAQREALAAAAEAYGEARDAFQRIRGNDNASRARVNRLAQLMHLCRRGASGQAIDLNSITDEQGDFTEESEQPIPVEPDGGIGDTPEGGEGEATGG